MKKSKLNDIFGIILYIIAGLLLVNCIRLCDSSDVWYDEIFSMEFVTRPMSGMLAIAMQDVHPPLYYILVRIAEVIAGGIGIDDTIAVAKFMSVVPYILLMVYGITIIRKRFNMLTAGLFAVMVIGMPQMYDMTLEIRMYSWALFFVTAAFIHGIEMMRYKENPDRKPFILNTILVIIYGTAACYTHYYGMIAAYSLYLGLFIWSLADKGGKKTTLLIVTFPIISAILYIPWISVVISQTKAVAENYWIQPVTLRTFPGCAKYILLGTFNSTVWGYIFAGLSGIIIVLAVFFAGKGIKEQIAKSILLGIFVLVMLVVGGFVLSILIRPVFVYRYMIPALGVFWLAIAIAVGSMFPKYMALIATMIFVIVSLRDYQTFNWSEGYKKDLMAEAETTLSGVEDDTIIICNFNHIQALSSFYINNFYEQGDNVNTVYAYQTEPEPLIPVMLKGIETLGDDGDDKIKSFLEQGKKVIFLGSFNSREDVISAWEENYGIISTYITECMVERYWFNVYELSLSD
ncbi:MAG: hypothetical protein K6A23_07925 [Butyrivibrio sp.]|nr:hypothetical protein [Butyrivibrio sp.]